MLERAKKLAVEYDEKVRRRSIETAAPVESLQHAISFPEIRGLDLLCHDAIVGALPGQPQLVEKWYIHGNVGFDSPEDLINDLVRKRIVLQHALALIEVAAGQAPRSQPIDVPVMSVLFLAADPTNATRLRLGQEFREIQEKLKLGKLRDRFKLEVPQLSLRAADISQAMLDLQPALVHFSGHGTKGGALCFEDQAGRAQLVKPEALAALFKRFTDSVQCVLLNSCYSEAQARAISAHIPYVIGMNKAIGDDAAIAFAVGFYQALGAGKTIEDSHGFGCVQIMLRNIPENLTPVLIRKP